MMPLRSRHGSLLVITLWLVTILSVLAIAIARYLSVEIRLTKYRIAREQAKALARGGVYLAMQRLAKDVPEKLDWLQDDWAFTPDHPWMVSAQSLSADSQAAMVDHVEIAMTDEERKFDLNTPGGNLVPVLTKLLGDADAAAAIANAVDPTSHPEHDQPDLPYFAKHAPIDSLEEVLEIPAVQDAASRQPAVLTKLLAQATVYTAGRININTASAEVLDAVKNTPTPTVDPGVIAAFVGKRGVGPDQQPNTADDCLVTNDVNVLIQLETCLGGVDVAQLTNLVANLSYESSVFRIVAKGVVVSPALQYQVEAIVHRPASGEFPKILAWREG